MENKKIALILNLSIIILSIIGFKLAFETIGIETFTYYTEDSNLLLLIASCIFSIYLFFDIDIPNWLKDLKYTATVSVTITLLVVLFVLSWMLPNGLIYLLTYKSMLYHHTLCPILAIISFICFENYNLKETRIIKSLYFTAIYAIILISLNILKIVNGPYPFLKVYMQPFWISIMWIVVIFGFAYIIAYILKKLKEKVII